MLDTVQTVAQNLSQTDVLVSVAIRFVGGIMVGVVVAVLLICAGFVVAQCCRGSRQAGIPAALLLLVACLLGDVGTASAQEPGAASAQEAQAQESIPEVEPRFERLFGTDSLRLTAGVGGPNDMRSPSLSPDGKWVVFSAIEDAERANLWLAPVDGGEMVRLTQGQFFDDEPRWFASGDAIAFLSTRPGGTVEGQPAVPGTYVMRMPISPENGRPTGPARQVSLDNSHVLAISPDDQWIAYARFESYATTDRSSSLKVLPSTGGIPRTVLTVPGAIVDIRWGGDGSILYFLYWSLIEGEGLAVMRIPMEGGTPDRLSTWDDNVRLNRDARYLFRGVPSEGEEGNSYEVCTVEGERLARVHLPEPFDLMGFADAPGKLLAVRTEVANPLRVLPVTGGPVQRLNEAWGYDMPLDWTPDSREVFFKTRLNGQPIYMLAPLDGSPMRQVPLPKSPVEGWPILSGDGEHVLFFRDPPEGTREAWVYDIGEDRARKLDEGPQPPGYSYWRRWGIRGAGGTFMRDGTAFLYGIHRNARYELLAADPEGTPRLLWSFPEGGGSEVGRPFPPEVAVHGNRVAFALNEGEEASLYLAQPGEDQAHRLLTLPGLLSPLGHGPSMWSPDGRRVAMTYVPPDPAKSGVLVVDVGDDGEVVGEPLMLEGGGIGQWMPDSQHFLGGGNWSGDDQWGASVWLVSLDPDEEPVLVSAGLQESIWYFRLSPDGQYITFEGEVPRGSSVWRVDLGDIIPGAGR